MNNTQKCLYCLEKGRHFIFHEANYFVPGFILCRRQQGRPVDEVELSPSPSFRQGCQNIFLTWARNFRAL